jgi:hypothetical protein
MLGCGFTHANNPKLKAGSRKSAGGDIVKWRRGNFAHILHRRRVIYRYSIERNSFWHYLNGKGGRLHRTLHDTP